MPAQEVRLMPNALVRTLLQNGAPAEGFTFEQMAGAIRWLHEYASGAPVVTTEPPLAPAPPNARGVPGHDHSGGVHGRTQTHTVWSASYGYEPGGAASNYEAPYVTDGGGSNVLIDDDIGPIWFPRGAAYTQLTFDFLLRVVTATSTWALTLTGPDGTSTTQTAAMATGSHAITVTNLVPTAPGRIGKVHAKMVITPGTSASVYLICWGLHQLHVGT